jgi:hypothetical protein
MGGSNATIPTPLSPRIAPTAIHLALVLSGARMTASVPSIPVRRPITAPATTMCHARYLARKAVKQQMQAEGYKVSHIEPRFIAVRANDYLDRYRDDLIAQATMTIDAVPSLRKIAEQEARKRRRTVR